MVVEIKRKKQLKNKAMPGTSKKGGGLETKESPFKLKDACYRKAKAKYSKFPSAYASGYIAKCRKRKGNIK